MMNFFRKQNVHNKAGWLLICMVMILAGCHGSDKSKPLVPWVPETGNERKYVNFESAPVRPIAVTKDGNRLLVTNTPNHSLEIFRIGEDGQLQMEGQVKVGMDPVAVAVAPDGSAWVVNHMSDSISIVELSEGTPYVADTLWVGDEPRDIVFAQGKAFVTTAHRGQRRTDPALKDVPGAGDPQLFSPGVARADVWVFDASNPGAIAGGKPVSILSLFGDTPRALAVSPDEQTVYVAVFHSGNQTTAVHEAVLCYGFTDDEYGSRPCKTLDEITTPGGLPEGMLPGGRPGPGVNRDGEYQPWASLIVKYDRESGEWRDELGRNFNNGVRFSLPDTDVFAIDASTLQQQRSYRHVGTTLFNMAVNPVSNTVYVTNTDANNATRFEGPGNFGGSTVQGHIAPARISLLEGETGEVKIRPLNRHIDYSQLKAPPEVRQHTIALPTQVAVSHDGSTLYVASLGSDKVAVYQTTELDNDSFWDDHGTEFDPEKQVHIPMPGGPVGLLLNENKRKLYVYTRFDNSIAVWDFAKNRETARIPLLNPEPAVVQAGRRLLYDAKRSSSNGEAACGSCHIFGDSDQLAWDLGNPDASNIKNPQPFPTRHFSRLGCDFVGRDEPSCQLRQVLNGNGDVDTIASMKGPMFTQTLRGMSTHGHMHWRGDRSVGYFGRDKDQLLDEKMSFKNFIVAFEGLLGMDIDLPESVSVPEKSPQVLALEREIDQFAEFALHTQMPPNPIRALDNRLSESARRGKAFFLGERRSDGLAQDSLLNGPAADGVNCEGCHGLDPARGFYGTRGEAAHGGEAQVFKVPQLRNLYTRVGMFGLPDREGFLPSHTRDFQGDQIRGFGFLHDGATDLLFNFLKGGVFDNGEAPCPPMLDNRYGCEFNSGHVGIPDDGIRQDLVQYLMEFDNDIAPIVGQQVTLSAHADQGHLARLELLEQRAGTPFVSKILGGTVTECDLIAQGRVGDSVKSYAYSPVTGLYQPDSQQEPPLSEDDIRALATQVGNTLTFTCVVPGDGVVRALDHDLDGVFNRDEELWF